MKVINFEDGKFTGITMVEGPKNIKHPTESWNLEIFQGGKCVNKIGARTPENVFNKIKIIKIVDGVFCGVKNVMEINDVTSIITRPEDIKPSKFVIEFYTTRDDGSQVLNRDDGPASITSEGEEHYYLDGVYFKTKEKYDFFNKQRKSSTENLGANV